MKDKPGIDITHPNLLKDWDFENNEIYPSKLTKGCHFRARWICHKCGNNWVAEVASRASGGRGCPHCLNRAVNEENNLLILYPKLCRDWDYTKNDITPKEVVPGSHKKVWWLCSVCKHSWLAVVRDRALGGNGCKICSGRVATEKNNLAVKFPGLLIDWDYDKNDISPYNVLSGSGKRVFWICHKCGYKWEAAIKTRVYGSGCRRCLGRVATKTNNLVYKYPKIAEEWNFERNKITPDKILPNSHLNVWWKCKNNHEWRAVIYSRMLGHGCPICANRPVSVVSQKWLDLLGIPKKFREHYLRSCRFTFDAYDQENNTIYEFLGDYWHGNPKIFSAEEKNPTRKVSYGQLYKETMERLYKLKDMGYKVIYIWESDFIEGKTYSIL